MNQTITLDSKTPPGPIAEKWSRHKTEIKLVNEADPKLKANRLALLSRLLNLVYEVADLSKLASPAGESLALLERSKGMFRVVLDEGGLEGLAEPRRRPVRRGPERR